MIKFDIEKGEELSIKQIDAAIKAHHPVAKKYIANELYWKGKNPTIIKRDAKTDSTIPDNRVMVPFARNISLTIKNYMFKEKPEYIIEDDTYSEKIQEVFINNSWEKKIDTIGKDLVVHGNSYKLFYVPKGETSPKYAIVKGSEIIPIYNYAIEPELVAVIHYIMIDDETKITVYYDKNIKYYIKTSTDNIKPDGPDDPNLFEVIPVVPYGEYIGVGVFDPVKSIIDAIDKIVSSDLDEIEKFELAYLILKGQKMDKKNLTTAKDKRLFELDEKATLEYLTKQVDGEFHGSVRDFLVEQVHNLSGVPDFASKDFAAESGVALLYKLMGLEIVAAEYEADFKEGERQSIAMIERMVFRNGSIIDKVKFMLKNKKHFVQIEMTRNLPNNVKEKLENAKLMKEIGISDETIIESILAALPVDAVEERKRQAAEKAALVNIGETTDEDIVVEDGVDAA